MKKVTWIFLSLVYQRQLKPPTFLCWQSCLRVQEAEHFISLAKELQVSYYVSKRSLATPILASTRNHRSTHLRPRAHQLKTSVLAESGGTALWLPLSRFFHFPGSRKKIFESIQDIFIFNKSHWCTWMLVLALLDSPLALRLVIQELLNYSCDHLTLNILPIPELLEDKCL